MPAYADYSFYTTTYKGSTIPFDQFERLALEASAEVDYQTFERASVVVIEAVEAALIEKIKMATCSIADLLFVIEQEGKGKTGTVSGERVGDYSVNYAVSGDATATKSQRIENALRRWLGHTGLLFRGAA